MKASLSLLLLLSALGTAMADVSTVNRTLLFNDDFDTLSASQDGKGTQWNYIDYVSWDNVNARNWRTYQSNDTSLTELRKEDDTSFVSLWGRKGNYHTENTSTSNTNKVEGKDVYACGGLFTQKTFTFQYGYVEARARFDCVQGCWPAIWMLPANGQNWPNNGEIDILEHLNSETIAYQTLHFFANNGTSDASAGLQGKITGELTGWHTYGMEWAENAITFYVDGTKTGTITGDAYTNWPFDRENNEFYLMIDQQIGGNWVEGTKGIDDKTLSERGAALDIDYIRVYSAESTDSNIWKNGTASWTAGTLLDDGRAWQDGGNMNFVGTKGEIAVSNVTGSYIKAKDGAQVRLNGGTITTAEGGLHLSGESGTKLTIGSNINNTAGLTISGASSAQLELAGVVSGEGSVILESGNTLVSGSLTTDLLTLKGDAAATTSTPGAHLNVSGTLNATRMETAANTWLSPVHLTVKDGGHTTIGTVQGLTVNDKVGQIYLAAQDSGTLSVGTLSNAGGVVNINATAADTGRVCITEDAKFYQLFLSHGELELHSDRITMNNGGKIELKGGTLLWDGDMNDSKLVYNGGAVKLTTTPTGNIELTGSQKLEMETLGTQVTTLEKGTTLATTENWTISSSTNLTGEGTLEITSGIVTLNKQLNNDNMVAGIHVKDGATLAVTAKSANGYYAGTVTIDKGGEMTISEHTAAGGIVPVVGSDGSIINNGTVLLDQSNTSEGEKWVNGMSGTGAVKVECAKVRLASTKAEFTGSVEVSKGGGVRIAGAATNFDTLAVLDGSMEIITGGQLSAKELNVAADGTITAKVNSTEATLTISGLLNAANGSHLNADLVLAGGAVLNVSGSSAAGSGLIMGSSITLSDKVVLGSNVVQSLASGATSYVLATSMDGFITDNGTRVWADGGIGNAADYFTLALEDKGLITLSDYTLGYTGADGNGVLTISLTAPEPATATLSLLALAALAARRRR